MHPRLIVVAVIIALISTSRLSAQTADNPFRFGTTLAVFAGGTADSEGPAPAAGLELGWEITRRLAIDGATLWSVPGNGQHDFAVLIGPKFNVSHSQTAVPFFSAAVGMYRASFDSLAGPLPPFYASRVNGTQAPNTQGSFDDFVTSVGGGAELFVHPHWAVRPDVRVLMVFGNSDVHWITAFGAHVAYHFEKHRLSD